MDNRDRIQTTIDDFSTAWPSGRKDFRNEGDETWRDYARALSVLVSSEDAERVEIQLKNDNRQVRALAARALGFMARPRSAPVLSAALRKDEWATVRLLSADALGMIHTSDTRATLSEAAGNDESADVNLHIERALSRSSSIEESALKDVRRLGTAAFDSARIGSQAPDLALKDGHGVTVDLGSFRNQRAVALYFLYGDG
jgi:HEAT repeat protein